MSRIYVYRGGLFFEYKRNDQTFQNRNFGNSIWRIQEEWFVMFRLEKKLIGRSNFYYDGHTLTEFTLLGITIGYGYSYESKPIEEWSQP